MAYRDEDKILEPIYQEKICSDFNYEDLNSKRNRRKYIFKEYSNLQQRTHKIGFKCYYNASMHFRIML